MPNFISDAEMKKLESKKSFISDEEMAALESSNNKPQDFIDKYGEPYIRPSLQSLGGTLGSIAGGLTGAAAGGIGALPGAAVGGGLGYAGGEQVYSLIKLLSGKKKPTTTLKEIEKGLGDIVKGTAMEAAGMGAGAALSGITKSVPKVLQKAATSIYKVPKDDVLRIVSKPNQVQKYVGKSPFEIGENVLQHVQQRDAEYVKQLNKSLDDVIKTSQNNNKLVDVSTVVNSLKRNVSRIKGMTGEALNQKKELLDRVQVLDNYLEDNATKRLKEYLRGMNKTVKLRPEEIKSMTKSIKYRISPTEAQVLKRQLQDAASEKTALGLTFKRKDAAGKALTKASTRAKNAIESVIPEVKGINKKLQENIQIKENSVVKNALNPKGIENVIKNLQSTTGNKGFLKKQIRQIDKTLGTNLEEITKDVHAAKFLEPEKYLPQSVMGAATPAGIGYMTGGVPGAVIGGAISSPAVFRNVAPNINKLAPIQQAVEATTGQYTPQALRALIYQLSQEQGGVQNGM